ncbi:MAG TPA: lytic transglycosylase domain-containing protein [Thermoanaerobaculia bacterium]
MRICKPFRAELLGAMLLLAACASAPATDMNTPGTTPTTAGTAEADARLDLPYLAHERVDYWVERFSRGDKREEFASYFVRKPEYESMIREKLQRRGMPQDLIYLAMVESGFNPQARSLAEAVGIWQMVPDTARRYGLRVDETIDERRDPEKSTDAALSYLSYLFNRFGSWYLAAAAYNSGENRVARIMTEATGSERGSDAHYYQIWDQLPGETRDYVPAMIAAARIGNERARYGF